MGAAGLGAAAFLAGAAAGAGAGEAGAFTTLAPAAEHTRRQQAAAWAGQCPSSPEVAMSALLPCERPRHWRPCSSRSAPAATRRLGEPLHAGGHCGAAPALTALREVGLQQVALRHSVQSRRSGFSLFKPSACPCSLATHMLLYIPFAPSSLCCRLPPGAATGPASEAARRLPRGCAPGRPPPARPWPPPAPARRQRPAAVPPGPRRSPPAAGWPRACRQVQDCVAGCARDRRFLLYRPPQASLQGAIVPSRICGRSISVTSAPDGLGLGHHRPALSLGHARPGAEALLREALHGCRLRDGRGGGGKAADAGAGRN